MAGPAAVDWRKSSPPKPGAAETRLTRVPSTGIRYGITGDWLVLRRTGPLSLIPFSSVVERGCSLRQKPGVAHNRDVVGRASIPVVVGFSRASDPVRF